MMKAIAFAAICTVAVTCTAAVAQDDFPNRPVTVIVPYPAGGGSDLAARTVAERFQEATGQPMVIDNRPGGNGMIGAAACKNAKPDGYTYCMPISDLLAINPYVFKTVPYDAEKDFTAVAPVARAQLLFLVNSKLGVTSLEELGAWSKENPEKANFATWGIGSAAHLAMEALNEEYDGAITAVAYPGAGAMLQAMLTGEISATLLHYGVVAQHVENGTLQPLAILGEERYDRLPEVPTVYEQGFEFTPTVYAGFFAPNGVPEAVLDRMESLVLQAVEEQSVIDKFNSVGFVTMTESPEDFAERLRKDRATWAPIAERLNLALE